MITGVPTSAIEAREKHRNELAKRRERILTQ